MRHSLTHKFLGYQPEQKGLIRISLLILCASALSAQVLTTPIVQGSDPTGDCNAQLQQQIILNSASGKLWVCNSTTGQYASSSTGTVNSGLVNQLARYAASGTTIGGLATANSGVLVTSGAGVPSISTTLPNGLALGTPVSGTATNLTGLPIAGITGLGTGVATALAASVSGSGAICLASGSACGGGSGTVTTLSVATANGVSGSVANPTTTPAITLTLGDITPSSVASTGAVTGTNLYSMTTAGHGYINFPGASAVGFFLGLSSLGGATGALCGEFQSYYPTTKVTNFYVGTGTADATSFVAAALYDAAGNRISGTTTVGVTPASGSTIGITLSSPPTINQGPGYYCVAMNAGNGTVQVVDQNLPASVYGEATSRFFTMGGVSWSMGTATWPSTLGARTHSFSALWALGTP